MQPNWPIMNLVDRLGRERCAEFLTREAAAGNVTVWGRPGHSMSPLIDITPFFWKWAIFTEFWFLPGHENYVHVFAPLMVTTEYSDLHVNKEQVEALITCPV